MATSTMEREETAVRKLFARVDDVLDVVTWPVAVKGASIVLAQEVRRGEDVLVRAQVRVAFISEGRAQPIPRALRTLLKADVI